MDSTDRLRRRVRLRYELKRAASAILGAIPLLSLGVLAAYIQPRGTAILAFSVASFAAGAVMLWWGRDPQRAMLPGAVAGLVPLALVVCVSRMHECDGGTCATVCMPVSILGGALAGLFVGTSAHRRGLRFAASASVMALLTGAIGCSCAGYTGLAGLALGYAAGMGPELLLSNRRAA